MIFGFRYDWERWQTTNRFIAVICRLEGVFIAPSIMLSNDKGIGFVLKIVKFTM